MFRTKNLRRWHHNIYIYTNISKIYPADFKKKKRYNFLGYEITLTKTSGSYRILIGGKNINYKHYPTSNMKEEGEPFTEQVT